MSLKRGFTLFELVIVIVILAIIAAVAIPKYVSLSTDARVAALKGVRGAMESTSLLIEVKAKADNIADGSVELNGQDVQINNGYISGHWNNSWRYALQLSKEISFTNVNAVCTKNELCGVGYQRTVDGLPDDLELTGERGLVLIWPINYSLSDLCYAFYYNPGDEKPTTGVVDDGC